jgi:hypothetical protein
MCKVMMNVEAANRAIRDGVLPKVIEQTMATLKPEAAYFTTFGGERTALFVFDLKNTSDIPSIAEPFFQQVGARIDFSPVMNAEDLKTGLGNLPKK